MDATKRAELENYITGLAKQSLRAISLAHRVVSEGGNGKGGPKGAVGEVEDMEELETELVLDAVVGITVGGRGSWWWCLGGWLVGVVSIIVINTHNRHDH